MNRKLLFAGTWRNTPALFVTDGAHQSCMIRRADFKSWETRDGIRKSDTPGGWGMTWPVGAHALSGELKDARLVILTEGFWDFLAAFVAAFAHYGSEASMRHVCIAAMSTGSPAIAESALPLFAGRHVRIIFHAGDKGRDGKPDLYDAKGEGTGYRAALKWRDQLVSAGATVDAMHLADIQELQGKGDLNDAVSAAFAATPEHRTPALFGALFADFPARP